MVGGKIKLEWLPLENNSGFQIYRKDPGEVEFTPISMTSAAAVSFTDHVDDGIYQYGIATQRSENGQTALSAMSDPITLTGDGTKPNAPKNMALELSGGGVVVRWEVPDGDSNNLTYNLYRLALPENAVANLEGVGPLQTNIPELIALDIQPSIEEHLYVVTAVDKAGNESIASNSDYLNVELLPVSSLSITLADQGQPVVNWSHQSTSIAGYDIYQGADQNLVKLNDQLITATTYQDVQYNQGGVVQWSARRAPLYVNCCGWRRSTKHR